MHIMNVVLTASFNQEAMSDAETDRRFRFTKAQILQLHAELEIPYEIKTYNRHVCTGITALCILLARLASGM